MDEERKNDNPVFAKHLRRLLNETGHSQQEVADYVGVTRQAVAQWKEGKTIPDINNFRKLAQYFNVPYEYLIGDTESRVREHYDLVQTLGLSDYAIHSLQYYAHTHAKHDSPLNYPLNPYESDEDEPYCISQADIISRILADPNFGKFLNFLQDSIQQYHKAEYQEYLSITNQETILDSYAVQQVRSSGYELLSHGELSDFYGYSAEKIIRDVVLDMPDKWLMEQQGRRKPDFFEPRQPDKDENELVDVTPDMGTKEQEKTSSQGDSDGNSD